MQKTWVLVADRSRARIFSTQTPKGALREIEDLVHPEARAHERDLTSDRPGRSSDRHALGNTNSARDQQATAFAREISLRLEAARTHGNLERLVLICAPDLLGLLRKALSAPLEKLVIMTIDKNLTQQDAAVIRKLLPEFL